MNINNILYFDDIFSNNLYTSLKKELVYKYFGMQNSILILTISSFYCEIIVYLKYKF